MSWWRRARRLVPTVCLPAALALLVSAPSVAEESSRSASVVSKLDVAGSRATRCQRLRGEDLAPGRLVKLVKRRNGDNRSELLGCVLPRGRVYKVAYSESGDTYGRSFRLLQVAGPIVLVETSGGDQYGSEKVTLVRSLRSGRGYNIALSCSQLFNSCPGNTSATAAFVNSRGQAVAAIVAEGADTVSIVGFSPRGERQQLDSGPPDQLPASSLRLTGDTATWTNAGAPRSATLPGS